MSTDPPMMRLACGRCGCEVPPSAAARLGDADFATEKQAEFRRMESPSPGACKPERQPSCPRCRRPCQVVPRELFESSPTIGKLISIIVVCAGLPPAIFGAEFARYNGTADDDLIGVRSGGAALLLFPLACFAIHRRLTLSSYPDRSNWSTAVLGALGCYAITSLVAVLVLMFV